MDQSKPLDPTLKVAGARRIRTIRLLVNDENNVFLQLIPHGMVVSLRTKWPADRKENNFLECFSELLGMGGGWAWDTCSLDVAT